MADQDFQEEDVWGVVNEREESNHKVNKPYKMKKRSPSHDGARRIPRSSNEGSKVPHQHQQSSAPMGIPDWSKIYKGKSQGPNGCYENGHVEDEDEEDEMVPPHEYIARRLARSHITSSSMCEGVGRTLKGRDLSKLRNAILTKTGFLE